MEIRENIPVSKLAEVTVELLTQETSPGFTLDRERGFVTFTAELARGAAASVDLAYAINVPKDWQ